MRFAVGLLVISIAFLCGTLVSADDQGATTQASMEANSRQVTIDLWYVKIGDEAKAVAQEFLTKTGSPPGFGVLGDRQDFVARLAELQKHDHVTSSYHLRATTLDRHKLTIQISEQRPQVRGMTLQQKRITRTIELADVGMILRTTPEIVSDGQLKVFVEFEESTLVDTDVVIMESSDGTQSETAGGTDSVVMETVVKVRTGYPCLLTGTAARGTKRPSGHLLVICAIVGDE
jgi:hypothetical protein